MKASWIRSAALGIVLVASAVPAGAQPLELDGLAGFLQARIEQGSTRELVDVIEALEAQPLPGKAHEAFVTMLAGVASRAPDAGLLERVRRLPRGELPAPEAARPLSFPADHAAHPGSLSEWWYFNGHLRSGDRRFGFELTFFRTAVRLNFVHTALSDLTAGRHPFERSYRSERDCSVSRERMGLVYGPHRSDRTDDGRFQARFEAEGHVVDLVMIPRREPMIVNGDGVIDMPEGTTSRYYSYTMMEATGTVRTPAGEVLEVDGQAWFDHQWGHFISLFRPWDWFSFQMEDGSEYNLFHFRPALGFPGRSCANVLRPDGRLEVREAMTLSRREWWESPRSGDHFVTRWRVSLPDLDETFLVTTPLADQEMPRVGWYDLAPAYWEGVLEVVRTGPGSGTSRGLGYGEHMPYRSPWPAGRTRRFRTLHPAAVSR